jgi:hypothetical protein
MYDRAEKGIGFLDKVVNRRNRLVVVAFVESQEDIHGEHISTVVLPRVRKNSNGYIFLAKDFVLRQCPIIDLVTDLATLRYLLYI